MARDKQTLTNIDKSDLVNWPNGRVKDNTGADDGTPVNELVYGDLHEFFAKLMRDAGISYNGLPDNVANGYQLVNALKAFATKNSYIASIGESGGKLTLNTKVGTLKENEAITCKSTVDIGSETVIRGTDNTEKNITKQGNFESGEYVRLINKASSIELVRISDHISLDSMVSALLFLKAATNPQELAGLLNTVATTPQGNILAFVEWVNGAASSASLASAIRNGLYPKEHFQIVENIGNDRVRNIGWFSGVDINGGTTVQNYPRSGNVSQARRISQSNGDVFEITMDNTMDNLNYYVRIFIESQSAYLGTDNDFRGIVFKPISTTVFHMFLEETASANQNLKIHIEAIQI
ncbi:hypothetical protein [Muricauda sp. MAR_2010_75]|uniref:hypothetical protein n=1 Tax=Allomuricauda sp. MAR_2010_75 TaxID=1250232 RepID=UPI00068973C8|nr:hypothetical protein [Muricauda sp. MAR_2010_75]